MRKSLVRQVVKRGLWLAGVTVLAAVLPVGADQQAKDSAPVCGAAGDVLLLADQSQSGKQNPAPPPAAASKKAKKSRPMEAPAPQMEREDSKASAFEDGPERAGTRKIGGQVIRSKED